MNTRQSIFASRLAVLMLTVCIGLGLVACSKDDNDQNDSNTNKSLIGTWRHDEPVSLNNQPYWIEISFYANGTCHSQDSRSVKGDFEYRISSGFISYKGIWTYKGGDTKEEESVWPYQLDGDVLYLDHVKYLREK